MRKVITGDQVAQIRNPDPFAFPIWRAPVYRTPGWIIAIAQLGRFTWLAGPAGRPAPGRVAGPGGARVHVGRNRLARRHPPGRLGGAGPGLLAGGAGRCRSPAGWLPRSRSTWRAWRYRRRWASVMTISGLAPWYQGRIILPVLGKVRSTRYVDRVQVRLVSGQSAAEVADVADNLAHGFGAILCRVRTARSGAVLLEFVRRDALAQVVPPAPVRAYPDLRALEVGRREDGLPWLVRLHGTHVLVAGATGAGKASLLWGLVRAMFPLMQDGLVRVLAADPKLMELAFGRIIFDTHGDYAADPAAIADMLERAVADMQARAARFAGIPARPHPHPRGPVHRDPGR